MDAFNGTCTATTGNSWSTTQECFNQVDTSACTITQPTGWKLNHTWCQDPGASWSQSYSGLSCIKSDKSVELLSSTSETVTSAWVVGSRLIYSSVEGGSYSLKAVSFDKDGKANVTKIVSGIEMYEVAGDPVTGTDRLIVNGLRFSDNSYIFGYYNFKTDRLDVETGLTGLVETILIVGN